MPLINEEEIQRRATYHPPTEAAKKLHGKIRDAFTYSMRLSLELPDGREQSVAMTKLEEWMFWANAAIARNHDKL